MIIEKQVKGRCVSMNIDYKLIGSRIQTERKKKGYTQEVLAEKLDVSIGYISQVERGITKINLELLSAISSILDCDICVLFSGTVKSEEMYLSRELAEEIGKLNTKQKKLLYEFIKILRNY